MKNNMYNRFLFELKYPNYYKFLFVGEKYKNVQFDLYDNFNENILIDNNKLEKEFENNIKNSYKKFISIQKNLPELDKKIFSQISPLDFTRQKNIPFETYNEYNLDKTMSNAGRKIYEIIYRENIISDNIKKLNHFDICGFPGSFIIGINYYLKIHKKNVLYNWKIQSYKSDNVGFLKDNYGLLKKYPKNFLFGSKKTNFSGDITNVDNIKEYYNYFKNNKNDLVTSDCGIGVSYENSHLREQKTLKIFFGQFICGLMVLKKGGSLIMKSYSQFKKFSLSLIYLMTILFEKVYIIKPESSRQPLGKEIYIVCVNYNDNLTLKNFNQLLNVLEKYNSEKDYNKSLISFKDINKTNLVENIKIINNYFSTILSKLIEGRLSIDKILDPYKDNISIYFKKLKELDYFLKQKKKKYYIKYFIRMKYRKIEDKNKI